MNEIREIIEKLKNILGSVDVFNQYRENIPGLDIPRSASIRAKNLELYLNVMKDSPILLLGEAAGYKGARFSGVPMLSERQIVEKGISELSHLPLKRTSTRARPFSEPTATIVRRALRDYPVKVIIWNLFPLHPHKPHQYLSNRSLRKQERILGLKFLLEFLKIIKPEFIIACGKIAENALREAGIDAFPVRHPANGGKRKFLKGLEEAMKLYFKKNTTMCPYKGHN